MLPGMIPGVTIILSFPSNPQWELNVVLIVPDRSSYASPLVREIGVGPWGSLSNAIDNVKLPYAGPVGLMVLASNTLYVKLKMLARGASKLAMCNFVSSTELGLLG